MSKDSVPREPTVLLESNKAKSKQGDIRAQESDSGGGCGSM